VHVCIVFSKHGGTQVEVFDFAHHAPCHGCGDNAVKEKFGSSQIGHFGADIAHVFNTITTNSPPNVMRNGFFGSVGTYDAEISGVMPWGNGSDWDEEHGVGPGNHWSALGQAMDFSSIGLLPEGAI